jgi:hypothetical protein
MIQLNIVTIAQIIVHPVWTHNHVVPATKVILSMNINA